MHIDDLVGRGVPVDEATRQAHVLFGNARARREEIDDMQRLPFLETFVNDVRYAFRMMRRSPGFTLTAVVTLALVIGANTAVFTLANALLLKPLPLPEADRLGPRSTGILRSDGAAIPVSRSTERPGKRSRPRRGPITPRSSRTGRPA